MVSIETGDFKKKAIGSFFLDIRKIFTMLVLKIKKIFNDFSNI